MYHFSVLVAKRYAEAGDINSAMGLCSVAPVAPEAQLPGGAIGSGIETLHGLDDEPVGGLAGSERNRLAEDRQVFVDRQAELESGELFAEEVQVLEMKPLVL